MSGQIRSCSRGIVSEEPALPPGKQLSAGSDEIVRAIEHVLDTMPARQREVASLRLRHQLPTSEIARRLCISSRSVEEHLNRATKALREQLPALVSGTPPTAVSRRDRSSEK